LAAYEILT